MFVPAGNEMHASDAALQLILHMVTNSEIKDYYDSFTAYELKRGINLRHYHVFNEIVKAGLKKHHHVLEIGCGIGQLTYLMHQYLRRGKLLSADISPQSVELARKRIGPSSRMEFVVSDMTTFTHNEKFDFLILPDVLEHIPVENHPALFGLMSSLMHEHSKIVIHIPHPKFIESDRIHHPERLQIIDQPLSAATFLSHCYPHGLLLDRYEAYSLFNREHDYVFIVLKRDVLPPFVPFPKWKIIWKKSVGRVRYFFSTRL